jgi:two-component system, LytTR family, sensor kinase
LVAVTDSIKVVSKYTKHHGSVKYHILFWVVLTVALTSLSGSDLPYFTHLYLELINMSFYSVVVYFNIFYLFPLYMKQRKLVMHLIWLLATAAVITPIKTLLLIYISPSDGVKALFIEKQHFIFISTFFVGAASSIYYILSDWMTNQNDKQELANQTLQSELKFLKSQINPHFLFNTLNSLYALTLKKSDLAPEIVLKLSEMMRYMLYECNEKSVPLEKEVNYLINYLDLEKLRHGKKIAIQYNQSGAIANQNIAPLIFIPFIENCFKHGVSHQIAQAFVNIELSVVQNKVTIEIENSKHATMPSLTNKKSGGIGLGNVKRRLDLVYPNQYKLHIDDTPLTYKVTLQINLN